MSDRIDIVIGGSAEDDARAFVETWHRLEAGEAVATQRVLSFESWEALASVMSQGRLQLMRALHGAAAASVQELADRLGRPYRRVHEDVSILTEAGLIERGPDRTVRLLYGSASATVRFNGSRHDG